MILTGPTPPYSFVAFIAGCPRSGTTWASDILGQAPGVVPCIETALFDCLRTPAWELFPDLEDAEAERPNRLVEALVNLAEPWLSRRGAAGQPEWRPVLHRWWGDKKDFVLAHVPFRPLPLLGRVRGQLVRFPRLLELIEDVEQAGHASHDDKVVHLATLILSAYYTAKGGPPGGVLLEKTPNHIFHAEFLLDRFPGSRWIEMLRDGRDVCVSMAAYRDWMPQQRRAQAEDWHAYVSEGLRLKALPRFAGRILTVRYEDLKADTANQIARMLEFLALPFDPALPAQLAEATDIRKKTDAGEGKHYRKGAVGEWRERFNDEDLQLFYDIAGATFDAVGYSR